MTPPPETHSPLPWHLGGFTKSSGGTRMSIWSKPARGMASGGWVAMDIAPSNAAFIVRAVNSHQALVEALRAIERLRLATDEGTLRVRADRMWEIATAALATVEERPQEKRNDET